jgi:arylsulfatase
VDEPGSISPEFVSVSDFMPVWLEVAKAEYPKSYQGRKIQPLVGESFLPLLKGGTAANKERTALFWYKSKSTVCFIKGKWKIVTLDCSKFENSKWELYDILEDRTEQNDLSARNPEKLSEMKKALVKSFSDQEAYDSFTKQFVKKSKKGKAKKKTKK